MSAIAEMLRRTRLVTIVGPGGVGKTRLAVELAHSQISRHVGGVWLVNLIASMSAFDVAAETARTLGVRAPVGTSATDGLQRYLGARDVLLLLDNCEHVVEGCAELAVGLLSSCRNIRVLATSRESLGVVGETVWRLGPLAAGASYRLFVERARQRQSDFIPSGEAEATIARVCERLDHLPLGIELAAARVCAMSLTELLAALSERLGALGSLDRLAPDRHRTVRATVEWSYQLLDSRERTALRSLAVFPTGFDADAAKTVGLGVSTDILAALIDKSLVVLTGIHRGRTRYRLLEPVRELALELLATAGELESVRDRHLGHFRALAEVARRDWLATGKQQLVNELDDDYNNVRAALEWAVATDPCSGLALLSGTRDLFFRFGQSDGLRLAQLLLARCPVVDAARAEVQISAGQLAITLGDFELALDVLAQARELSTELGEAVLEAWTCFFQGLALTLSGAITEGRELLSASRVLHRQLGLGIGEARSTSVLGGTFVMAQEIERGRGLLEEALRICVAEEDRWGQGQAHTFLGLIAPDEKRASAHFRQAVEFLRPSRDATLLPVALIGQAGVIAARRPSDALQVLAAASAIRARVGGEFAPFYRARLDGTRTLAEAKLGHEADELWVQGERQGLDEALALAFGTERRPRQGSPAGLSRREFEVAKMVAEGLANKAIAARLHLSVRTVESHVRHALAKLALENRTQLAAWTRSQHQ